jgi:hypothetical protein
MRAEHVVGIGVLAPDDELDLGVERHVAGTSSRRRIPATGIRTQSGRLLSS